MIRKEKKKEQKKQKKSKCYSPLFAASPDCSRKSDLKGLKSEIGPGEQFI